MSVKRPPLRNDPSHPAKRSHAQPTDTLVLNAFSCLALRGIRRVVGKLSGFARSSVKHTVESVTNTICAPVQGSVGQHICFRTNNLVGERTEFAKIAGLSNVIGVIDCTHIPILALSDHEDAYETRKIFCTSPFIMECKTFKPIDYHWKLCNI